MPIDFTCGDCGYRYRASRRNAGQRFLCQSCGWPMAVPGRPQFDPQGRAVGRADVGVVGGEGRRPPGAEATSRR